MAKRMAVCVSIVMLLAGCANTQWYNRNYASGDTELMANQKAIDEGYCMQVAHGAAPMPDVRVYAPTKQSYSISGTFTSYGQDGVQTTNYSGYVTPSPGASFSSGFAQGVALGAAIRARRAQDAIMKGCMMKLGWTDKPIEQQATPAPDITRAVNEPPIPTNAKTKAADADITCEQWATDIAETIDSGYRSGVDKQIVHRLAGEYIEKSNGSARQRLIVMSIINARYKIPLKELSSQDYPKYVRWECEQDWVGFGLGRS